MNTKRAKKQTTTRLKSKHLFNRKLHSVLSFSAWVFIYRYNYCKKRNIKLYHI